jgi:hypothetical protein
MTTRTITLTGRPPVAIDEDSWPIVASSGDCEQDGPDDGTNRISDWNIKVRRHEDGRAIVYATYKHTSVFTGEKTYAAKRGRLLADTPTDQDICDAIQDVCRQMMDAEHRDGDVVRWPTLAAECIADMPAEQLG